MDRKQWDRIILKYLAWIVAGVLVIRYFDVLTNISAALWHLAFPLVLGCVMAYVLNILLRKIESIYFPHSKKKIVGKTRRMVCILLSILAVLGILTLVIGLVVPELVNASVFIARGVPVFFERVSEWAAPYLEQVPVLRENFPEITLDWDELVRNLAGFATNGVSGLLNSTFSIVSVFAGGIMNTVISVICAI
jgi:predicted PurR-regulated permease PerM